jgi:hypothetical protein
MNASTAVIACSVSAGSLWTRMISIIATNTSQKRWVKRDKYSRNLGLPPSIPLFKEPRDMRLAFRLLLLPQFALTIFHRNLGLLCSVLVPLLERLRKVCPEPP